MDNMNRAIELVSEDMKLNIKEFTVLGLPDGSLFRHQWFVGTDDKVAPEILMGKIDDYLKDLNDDYITERQHALKRVSCSVISPTVFYDWMRIQGKEGGQNKFPRVLKGDKMKDWLAFLNTSNIKL
jgi:hypothetical protein